MHDSPNSIQPSPQTNIARYIHDIVAKAKISFHLKNSAVATMYVYIFAKKIKLKSSIVRLTSANIQNDKMTRIRNIFFDVEYTVETFTDAYIIHEITFCKLSLHFVHLSLKPPMVQLEIKVQLLHSPSQ